MRCRSRTGLAVRLTSVAAALLLAVAGCTGNSGKTPVTFSAPTPVAGGGDCGSFTIAYDGSNGYEASAFIVGRIATDELGCDVEYVNTTSRMAWRLVASGEVDVYLDAFGSPDLQQRLAAPGGPVTVVGTNGVLGGVDLLAPFFMAARGLSTARDLHDVRRIGWGRTPPSITTVPGLLALTRAFVQSQDLDYRVRDYGSTPEGPGTAQLLQQARLDDEQHRPNVYLVAAPRRFLGDGAGRQVVDIPESAARSCTPTVVSTMCSLDNFRYLKIVNSQFAHSESPAYNLVYNYRLSQVEAITVLEIVALSGYDVGSADALSWINTHRHVWQQWLE